MSNDEINDLNEMQKLKDQLGVDSLEGMVNQYAIIKEIAEGSLSKVLLVYNTEDGRYYACKAISKKRLRKKSMWKFGPRLNAVNTGVSNMLLLNNSTSASNNNSHHGKFPYMDMVRKEIAILKKLSRHPNIATLVEVLDDEGKDTMYMIMELCEHGAIMKIKLNDKVPAFPEPIARRYFRDIVLGLEYCKCALCVFYNTHYNHDKYTR